MPRGTDSARPDRFTPSMGAEIVLDTNAAELASPAGRREREARALVKSGRKPARFRWFEPLSRGYCRAHCEICRRAEGGDRSGTDTFSGRSQLRQLAMVDGESCLALRKVERAYRVTRLRPDPQVAKAQVLT